MLHPTFLPPPLLPLKTPSPPHPTGRRPRRPQILSTLPAPTKPSPAAEQALRKALTRRRTVRRTGLAAATTLLAPALAYAALPVLHAHPPLLPALAALLLAASTRVAPAVGRDNVLYLDRRAPTLAPLPPSSVKTLPTPARGRGAFATRPIPPRTSLGFYEGATLDTAAFLTRYPPGTRPEYCIALDSERVCDGADAARAQAFTPAHMNHAKDGNVGRKYFRRQGKVLFYTTRPVGAGEELTFDYGKDFWRGREADIVEG